MPIAPLILAMAVGPNLQATTPASAPVAAPADVDSVDHIIAAVYDVISGPAGQKRNWDRMRSLFSPGALMGAVFQTRAGATREADFTVDRYISQSDPVLLKEPFFEKELSRKTEAWAHLVQIFSTYESRHAPGEKPFERGINCFQLFNDGKRWWIRTIFWEGETPTQQLPRKYTR
ncbi:MAG TPA: hypothetical protein VKT78_02845 [Fimbriimonadaceae bacterium]|nr:hypothetical protein [Fimbriimonadaceae bacterium]